jgi:methylmalonyl-CoA/ethylmalonyl-CoA epimerase
MDSRLHHVGYVVASIAEAIEPMAEQLRARWDGQIIHDPLQKVRVAFLVPDAPGATQIELVEPAGPDAPVNRFLAAGGGMHHLCYEISALDEELIRMRALGAVLLRKPQPAVAFGGRRIAWVLTKQKLLLEYLEASQ